jgi:beta-1,4-mannosyl-glycoprotein beta-1,4-N-acetylglucosaminyltransferase
LNELAPYVDDFILVEANTTFAGDPKPLEFLLQSDRWRQWPQLSSVQVVDPPKTTNPWDRETYQRNAILRGLREYADDTVVLISDVDEIPRGSMIPRSVQPSQVYVFEQDLYYYTMTKRARERWRGTRACRLSDLRAWTPQVVRFAGGIPIQHGGWHFSYMGGVDAIQAKLAAFSHRDLNRAEYNSAAEIIRRVGANQDLFDREVITLETVAGLDHLPEYVRSNPSKFTTMIWS